MGWSRFPCCFRFPIGKPHRPRFGDDEAQTKPWAGGRGQRNCNGLCACMQKTVSVACTRTGPHPSIHPYIHIPQPYTVRQFSFRQVRVRVRLNDVPGWVEPSRAKLWLLPLVSASALLKGQELLQLRISLLLSLQLGVVVDVVGTQYVPAVGCSGCHARGRIRTG